MKSTILILAILIISASAFDWKKLSKLGKNKSSWMSSLAKFAKKKIGKLAGCPPKISTNGKPWFCHDLDCPEFQVINKTNEYESRCYPETTWVVTSMKVAHKSGKRTSPMFRKLFDYIQGENDKKTKIPMTAPVLTSVSMDKTLKNKLDVSMHFYVPPSQVASLPKPTRDDVKILKLSKMCVYVHSFGGWMMGIGKKMHEQSEHLKALLTKDGKMYDSSVLYAAGYDSPWSWCNRHNEVMFKKSSKMEGDVIEVVNNVAA